MFSRWTNRTQESQVYSLVGPIGRKNHRYILTLDQSDARITGIFSRWTNRTQESQVYSHDGRSDAGTAGIFLRGCPCAEEPGRLGLGGQEPGSGAAGEVDGQRVAVGTLEWVRRQGAAEGAPEAAGDDVKPGHTQVYVGVGTRIAGMFEVRAKTFLFFYRNARGSRTENAPPQVRFACTLGHTLVARMWGYRRPCPRRRRRRLDP
eukprot:1195210-Prorocentrum_minimum.AAC.9